MKYIVDTDSLVECLGCLDGMKINGHIYVLVELVKEFIRRFPKDPVKEEANDD